MRVLIAEDDQRVAGLLKNRLRSDHISADVCYDGHEALELSGVVRYDVNRHGYHDAENGRSGGRAGTCGSGVRIHRCCF